MTPIPAVDQAGLDLAVRTAARAGRLAAAAFTADTGRRYKADGTEVTDADQAVEDLIRSELARQAPGDAVYGEEAGETPGTTGRRWITDPISGTGYFTRGMPVFAVLLAFEDEHGPAIGVINQPMQNQIVFAGRGRGCWLTDDPDRPLPSATRVRATDPPPGSSPLTLVINQHAWSDALLLGLQRCATVAGSIHHPAFYLATGRIDAVVATHQGYEDRAPLPVIVTEAGGQATDLDGGPVLGGDGSVLAAGPGTHAAMLGQLSHLARTRGPKAPPVPPGDPREPAGA